MRFYFFLSYAGDNDDTDEVKRFYTDLSAEIRRQLGLKQTSGVVGFRDQDDLKAGVDWERRLAAALQNSQTLICLYSPAYFRSPWCGREWEVFHLRQLLYLEERRGAGEVNPPLPHAIKPINWVPSETPKVVGQIQAYSHDSLGDVYRKKGLFRLIHQYERYRIEYDDFIFQIAREILSEKDFLLPTLPLLENGLLGQITNPFHVGEEVRESPPINPSPKVSEELPGEDDLTTQKIVPPPKPPFGDWKKLRLKALIAIILISLVAVVAKCLIPFGLSPDFETIEKSDKPNDGLQQWAPADLGWDVAIIGGAFGRRVKGDAIGLFATPQAKNPFNYYRDFTLSLDVRFIGKKGVAWIVRAKDFNNYYLLELTKSTNGVWQTALNFSKCVGGVTTILDSARAEIDIENDQEVFLIVTEVKDDKFNISIRPSGSHDPGLHPLGVFKDTTFPYGGVGLCPKNGREILLQQWVVTPHQQLVSDKE